MATEEWLLIIALVLLIKHGSKTRREQQAESKRRSTVNSVRKETPCFFNDGISDEEFSKLAYRISKKLNRIKSTSIQDAIIHCTVESQSGYSNWDFELDYNNWGHITGVSWLWSENSDSNIPHHYRDMMTSEIQRRLQERGIQLEDYSDAIDNNPTLGTKHALESHTSTSLFKRVFPSRVILDYNLSDLTGEHLYSVLSVLKRNGFICFKFIPIKDTHYNSHNYLFEVEQIVINGNPSFKAGDIFPSLAKIVISYHEKQNIEMHYSNRHFKNRHYIDVINELHALGFSQIHENAIESIFAGLIIQKGTVKGVYINENEPIKPHVVYEYDVDLTVVYYTSKT